MFKSLIVLVTLLLFTTLAVPIHLLNRDNKILRLSLLHEIETRSNIEPLKEDIVGIRVRSNNSSKRHNKKNKKSRRKRLRVRAVDEDTRASYDPSSSPTLWAMPYPPSKTPLTIFEEAERERSMPFSSSLISKRSSKRQERLPTNIFSLSSSLSTNGLPIWKYKGDDGLLALRHLRASHLCSISINCQPQGYKVMCCSLPSLGFDPSNILPSFGPFRGMYEIKASDRRIQYSGRWRLDPVSSNVISSWTSCSFHLRTTSYSIKLELGDKTSVHDTWGSGKSILVYRIWEDEKLIVCKTVSVWDTRDNDGKLDLWREKRGSQDKRKEKVLEVALSDFGCSLELKSIFVESESSILPDPIKTPSHRYLFLGDSICTAFLQPTWPRFPHGIFDGFQYIFQDLINSYTPAGSRDTVVSTISYPGLLCTPQGQSLSNYSLKRDEGDVEFPKDQNIGFETLWLWEPWKPHEKWSKKLFSKELNNTENEGPTRVILELATNDLGHRVPAFPSTHDPDQPSFMDAYERYVDRVVQEFRETLEEIIILPPFPPAGSASELNYYPYYEPLVGFMEKFNQDMEKEEKKIKIKMVEIASVLTAKDTLDGLHPTAVGYEKLGKELYRVLETKIGEQE